MTSSLPMRPLSAREAEILTLFLGGKRVGQIARALNVSAKTVSTYMARCQVKYGVNNNQELVQLLQPPQLQRPA